MSRTERDQLTHLKTAIALESEISAFLIDREARGLSPRTIKFYRDELRHFYSWLESQEPYMDRSECPIRRCKLKISTPFRRLEIAKALLKLCSDGTGTLAMLERRRIMLRRPLLVSLVS
jgi:hypothetical protein